MTRPPGLFFYPARACAKGLSNRFCPSVSLSVCLSSEKILNQIIYWVKQLLYAAMTWQSEKNNVCVPDRDQNSSLLCTPALFYLMLVLSAILIRSTTWMWWRPDICGLQTCAHVHQLLCSQDSHISLTCVAVHKLSVCVALFPGPHPAFRVLIVSNNSNAPTQA